jgi:hypothetical protein
MKRTRSEHSSMSSERDDEREKDSSSKPNSSNRQETITMMRDIHVHVANPNRGTNQFNTTLLIAT